MKEIILTILITLLLDSASGDSTDDRRYNALKFGNNLPDYIIYKPDMGPLQNSFSVCSWVRSLRSSGEPSWLSYAVSSGSHNEILISDDGFYNHIFDSNKDLRSKFSIPTGTWYHYCYSWSLSSLTRRVYLNGELFDTRSTSSGRNLRTNGYLVIGNDQNSYGGGMETRYIFGGELYKLNFFSKELSSTEVQEMARDKCAEVEETYGDVRSIKWEEILLKTRNGDITEIESGCTTTTTSPLDMLRDKLQQTEGKLNDTLEELERTIEENEAYEANLDNKGQQLNDTLEELERTNEEKEAYEIDLENKGQQLNDTLEELERIKEEKDTCQTDSENRAQQLNYTLKELGQTKKEKDTCQTDLKNKGQQLNATAAEKQTTIEELDKTTKELNSTFTTLNQTQAELEHVKELLEKAANATPECPLNSTITSHWDLLYSEEFFGGIINAEKLAVLRKSLEKLEYFDGIRVTDGMIRFFKLFHDGEDQCAN